jgi:hypothetical protein
MKDYYFLFIAVALSIFAAIKQNKKKVDDINSATGQPERPKNSFLDQLMGEGFWDEPIGLVPPPARVKPAPATPSSATKKDSNTGEPYHPGFKRTLPDLQKRNVPVTVRKPIESKGEAELESEDMPGYLEDFSLRKAFVYSEIMNRKYESGF